MDMNFYFNQNIRVVHSHYLSQKPETATSFFIFVIPVMQSIMKLRKLRTKFKVSIFCKENFIPTSIPFNLRPDHLRCIVCGAIWPVQMKIADGSWSMHEHDLYIRTWPVFREIYRMCKYELFTSRLVWQRDIHTDKHDRNYIPRRFAGGQYEKLRYREEHSASVVLSWCTLWNFSRENLLMANNQPRLRNWPWKLPNSAK